LVDICNQFENIIVLNNKSYDFDGVKIIGSTLWTNIPDEQSQYIMAAINDYHLIKKYNEKKQLVNITTNDTNKWNALSISFIKKEIFSSKTPCIILTHHAPLFSDAAQNMYTAHPQYLNGKNNYAFHNNLQHLLKPPVHVWLYGHTHYTSNFKYNNVIIATNQLGYSTEGEKTKFNPHAYINLNDIIIDSL